MRKESRLPHFSASNLLHPLTLGWKLRLLSLSFLLPIFVLTYFFVNQSYKDINFAAKELDGTRYVEALRQTAYALASGDEAKAKRQFADVEETHAELGTQMAVADAFETARQAMGRGFEEEGGAAIRRSALHSLRVLVSRVADGSNLILDPDLDSYYSMDLVINKLPDLLELLDRCSDSAAPSPAGPIAAMGNVADREICLGRILGLMGDIETSLHSGFRGNPDGSLKKSLSEPYGELARSIQAFLVGFEASQDNGPEASPKADASKGKSAALAQTVETWRITQNELNRLLTARIDGFKRKLYWSLGVSIATLLVAGYLVLLISRSISRLMAQLEARTEEAHASNFELANANRKLSELDKMKTDFLSSVSHELRTPLTSIRGFAKLVGRDVASVFGQIAATQGDGKTKEKVQRILANISIIQDEGERLTRLINDVLDIAKIEAGRIDWKTEPSDVASVVRQAVSASIGHFSEKEGVSLVVDVSDSLPTVNIDRDRMVQVLINLLSNAAKFTHKGKVEVAASKVDDDWLLVTVRDTGEGFPQSEAEAIFDKFRQISRGDTLRDKPKGTGLGLAICKEIVEHFDGRIWAESEPGVGTLVSIRLPIIRGEGVAPTSSVPERLSPSGELVAQSSGETQAARLKPLILVVDDEENLRGFLSQLLREEGFDVATAANGREALLVAKEKRPDLVTMDIAMPLMDGDAAIALFRRDPELCRIPIIVVSALPGRERSAGDAVLGKPIDEQRFMETIHSLLRRQASSRDGGVSPHDQPGFSCIILCEESPPQNLPDYIQTKQARFCKISELKSESLAGFEGVVVIPSDVLRHIDFKRLKALTSLNLVVMPDDDVKAL